MECDQKQKYGWGCLNAGSLKLVAVLSMTIDHIGAALLPQYLFLRVIGRLAFPIYCYMIVNGMFYTKNCLRYMGRLLLLAVISESFFDYAFHKNLYYPTYQNVFFTLTIGLFTIFVIEQTKLRLSGVFFKRMLSFLLELVFLFAGCFAAYMLKTDYSFYGILMIFGFYEFRFNALASCAFQIYINLYLLGGVQQYAVAALPLLWLYNGEKGVLEEKLKWVFYFYYPVHLCLIGIAGKLFWHW